MDVQHTFADYVFLGVIIANWCWMVYLSLKIGRRK